MPGTPDPDSTSYADTIPVPDEELPAVPESLTPPGADRARISEMLRELGVAPPTTLEPPGPETSKDISVARSLGRYSLGGTLGRGGMGVVLEALDTELRRPVAVKTLRDPDGAGRGQLARFVAEARISGQLDHPNIVPVHDLGISADGELFFVMKLVRGRSLRHILDELRSGEPEALAAWPAHRLLTAFLQVCQAVAYAHGRGVVHRDLKPDNIMLGAYGEVVVMDWGIARVLNGEPELVDREAAAGEVAVSRTMDGAIIGTPGWMSPEQARGWLDRVDRTSDVWSLGAVLYSMLTFRPPFEDKNPLRLLYAAAKGSPEDPRERAPEFGIDPALAALCLRALAVDQADRPADAGILADEVEAFLAGSLARAESTRRWRLGGVAAVVLAGLALGTAALLFGLHDRAQTAEEAAVTLAEEAERDSLMASALRAEVEGRPAEAAALHRAVRSLPLGDGGKGDLVRLIAPSALRRRGRGPAAGAVDLVWPTSEVLAVGYGDGTVTLWRIASGGAQHLPDAAGTLTRLVLLEDGHVAACTVQGPNRVWSGADGIFTGPRPLEEECAAPMDAQAHAYDNWEAIALEGGLVQLVHRRERSHLLGGGSEVRALGFSPDGEHLAAARADGAVDLWSVGLPAQLRAGVGAGGAGAFVGAHNNLRVCRTDSRVVPMIPYPAVDTVWASAEACGSAPDGRYQEMPTGSR